MFHVLNRGVGRQQLFYTDEDYHAFLRVMSETLEKRPMRILGWCLMPNHWHMVLWPENDGDLGRFMQRLTVTHVTRWQTHYNLVGTGHVYQGRFKSFPVESDDHFYHVMRYVERNALRANLVERAEQWRFGSLWARRHAKAKEQALFSSWPLDRPRRWLSYVNEPANERELEALRRSCRRGAPYGTEPWVTATAEKLGLQSTLRRPGRPKRR